MCFVDGVNVDEMAFAILNSSIITVRALQYMSALFNQALISESLSFGQFAVF